MDPTPNPKTESASAERQHAARALEDLQAACLDLERLEEAAHLTGLTDAKAVAATIHDISRALQAAEGAGVPSTDLKARVAGARAIHALSPFLNRLQTRPRGYPGDFETMEQLWRGENRAPERSLGHLLETYAMSSAIARQHRNRVALQAACIRRVARAQPSCRVLSIGCGSSPDVRALIQGSLAEARFTLCDSDPDALGWVRTEIGVAGDRCEFVAGMVPGVLSRAHEHGPFAVVVTNNLFDYLPDVLIVRTLREAWFDLLAPGGLAFFTTIAEQNPLRTWLEYLADWPLIERSEATLLRLCREAGIPAQPALARDVSGLAIVATLRKGLHTTPPMQI